MDPGVEGRRVAVDVIRHASSYQSDHGRATPATRRCRVRLLVQRFYGHAPRSSRSKRELPRSGANVGSISSQPGVSQ
jgi:hypothetical protein